MFPSLQQAEQLLSAAEELNPGGWVPHSRFVAEAARNIAEHHPDLNPARAYVLGLLHDIGRRTGPNKDSHILDGHDYLLLLGFPDTARIALTHSFPVANLATLQGEWDGTPQERARLGELLAATRITEEDRLLQLCDTLALAEGFCTMQERLVDVALRYGFNAATPEKWRAMLQLKADFDARCGRNVYGLLPGLVERLTQ